MASQIPEVVIFRLPVYLYILNLLDEEKVEVVSSQEVGARLQMTPAQIRKDLSPIALLESSSRNLRALLASSSPSR